MRPFERYINGNGEEKNVEKKQQTCIKATQQCLSRLFSMKEKCFFPHEKRKIICETICVSSRMCILCSYVCLSVCVSVCMGESVCVAFSGMRCERMNGIKRIGEKKINDTRTSTMGMRERASRYDTSETQWERRTGEAAEVYECFRMAWKWSGIEFDQLSFTATLQNKLQQCN